MKTGFIYYHPNDGLIRGASGGPVDDLASYPRLELPLEVVEDFIMHRKNMHDYVVVLTDPDNPKLLPLSVAALPPKRPEPLVLVGSEPDADVLLTRVRDGATIEVTPAAMIRLGITDRDAVFDTGAELAFYETAPGDITEFRGSYRCNLAVTIRRDAFMPLMWRDSDVWARPILGRFSWA
jgi:hypothetical protein